MTERRELLRQALTKRQAYLVSQAFHMLTEIFPGGLLVDTKRGGGVPEFRVGPLGPEHAQFAIVKDTDGTRRIVDWPEEGFVLRFGVSQRTVEADLVGVS